MIAIPETSKQKNRIKKPYHGRHFFFNNKGLALIMQGYCKTFRDCIEMYEKYKNQICTDSQQIRLEKYKNIEIKCYRNMFQICSYVQMC